MAIGDVTQLMRRFLECPLVNPCVTPVLRAFRWCLPMDLLVKFAKVGVVKCPLNDSKTLKLFAKGDDFIATMLYYRGLEGFEPETLHIFSTIIKNSKTMFDIGANTGVYAFLAALESSDRSVYAFEPVPRIFERLEFNMNLNKINNLQLVQAAVTNFNGTVALYVACGNIPTSSSTLKGFRDTSESVEVAAMTLDQFISDESIAKVDVLKIDTEATEHLVLEGAMKMIKRDKPLIVCEVLPGYTEEKLQYLLDDQGYCYFWITKDGLIEKKNIVGDPKYKYLNYLFVHKHKVEQVLQAVEKRS